MSSANRSTPEEFGILQLWPPFQSPGALASPSALELSLLLLPPFGWQSWAAAGPDIWAASKEESILFHLPLSLTLSSPVFWSVGISRRYP